jgi:hypothetical protein
MKDEPFKDPNAVAYANFFLLRGLMKALVITGPLEFRELCNMLEGTIESAEKSGHRDAAEVIRGLRFDLDAYGT